MGCSASSQQQYAVGTNATDSSAGGGSQEKYRHEQQHGDAVRGEDDFQHESHHADETHSPLHNNARRSHRGSATYQNGIEWSDYGADDRLSHFGNSSTAAAAGGLWLKRNTSLIPLRHVDGAGPDDCGGSSNPQSLLVNAKVATDDVMRQQQRRRDSLEMGVASSGNVLPTANQQQQHRNSLPSASQAGISQEIVYQETIVRATMENDAIEAEMYARSVQQQKRLQQQQQQQPHLLSPKQAIAGGGSTRGNSEEFDRASQDVLRNSQGPQLSSVFQPLGLPLHTAKDLSDDASVLATPVNPLGNSAGGGQGEEYLKKRSFNPSHMTFGDVDGEDDNQTFTAATRNEAAYSSSGGGTGFGIGMVAARGGGAESYSRSTRGLEAVGGGLVSPTASERDAAFLIMGGVSAMHVQPPPAKDDDDNTVTVVMVPGPSSQRLGISGRSSVGRQPSGSEKDVAAANSTQTFLMQALPPAGYVKQQ